MSFQENQHSVTGSAVNCCLCRDKFRMSIESVAWTTLHLISHKFRISIESVAWATLHLISHLK